MELKPWGFHFNHDFWPFWNCKTMKPCSKTFIKRATFINIVSNIYKSVLDTKTCFNRQKITLNNEWNLGAIISIVWSKEQWDYMNEESSPLIAVYLHGASYCSSRMLRQTHQGKWINHKQASKGKHTLSHMIWTESWRKQSWPFSDTPCQVLERWISWQENWNSSSLLKTWYPNPIIQIGKGLLPHCSCPWEWRPSPILVPLPRGVATECLHEVKSN